MGQMDPKNKNIIFFLKENKNTITNDFIYIYQKIKKKIFTFLFLILLIYFIYLYLSIYKIENENKLKLLLDCIANDNNIYQSLQTNNFTKNTKNTENFLKLLKTIKIITASIYYFFYVKCINYINLCSAKILHFELIRSGFFSKYNIYPTFSINPSAGNIYLHNNMYIYRHGIKYTNLNKLFFLEAQNNLDYNVYSLRDFNHVDNMLNNQINYLNYEILKTIKFALTISIAGFILIYYPINTQINFLIETLNN